MITPDRYRDTHTHWSRPHLVEALLQAVAARGLDLSTATPDALAPLDQFHGGGKAATRMLARQAEVAAGMRVLDVGGGLGERLAAIQEARVRNAAEDRLRSVLAVFDRP